MFWGFMFLNWDEKYFIVSHKLSKWLHAKHFFVEELVNGLSSSACFQPSEKDYNASDSVKNTKWIRPKILISGKSLHFRKKKIVLCKEIGSKSQFLEKSVESKSLTWMIVVTPSLWKDFVTLSLHEYCWESMLAKWHTHSTIYERKNGFSQCVHENGVPIKYI